MIETITYLLSFWCFRSINFWFFLNEEQLIRLFHFESNGWILHYCERERIIEYTLPDSLRNLSLDIMFRHKSPTSSSV